MQDVLHSRLHNVPDVQLFESAFHGFVNFLDFHEVRDFHIAAAMAAMAAIWTPWTPWWTLLYGRYCMDEVRAIWTLRMLA